jgi:hypothetical protein
MPARRIHFALLLVSIIFPTLASASSPSSPSQVTNLNKAFTELRATRTLPNLVSKPNTSIVPNREAISEEVEALFTKIQNFVFGTGTLLTLRACDGCQAVADAQTMSVYIDPVFLAQLKSRFGVGSANIIAFVLAHEISHFTYEYITLFSPSKLSPNGNIPLLTKSFTDFVDLQKFMSLLPEQQQAETLMYLGRASRAHSEVDLLGLLSLKAMGYKTTEAALSYLQAEVTSKTPEERALSDFELRLANLRVAVANGEL